jgi:predicted MFS family arabinose efflux permease
VVLVAAHVGLHAAMAGMRMTGPLFALEEGYTAAQAGLLLAFFSISQILIALPAGRWIDRVGMRIPLMTGALVASLGIALSAVSGRFLVVCLSAACSGAAVGLSLIATQRHVGRSATSDSEIRRALSWLSLAPAISIFLGPLIAGQVIDRGGFAAAFLALASLPLFTLLIASRFPSEPRVESLESRKRSAWSIWGSPGFRRLMILNWLMTSSWDLHNFLVPVFAHELDMSASSIGNLLSAFALAAILSRIAVPKLAVWFSDWALLCGALVLAAGLLAAYPFMPGAASMMLLSFFLGALLGSIQPTVLVLVHRITPHQRIGDALAMRLMMINASGISMPVTFGFLGSLVGTAAVFVATSSLVAVGAATGYLTRARSDDSGPSHPH